MRDHLTVSALQPGLASPDCFCPVPRPCLTWPQPTTPRCLPGRTWKPQRVLGPVAPAPTATPDAAGTPSQRTSMQPSASTRASPAVHGAAAATSTAIAAGLGAVAAGAGTGATAAGASSSAAAPAAMAGRGGHGSASKKQQKGGSSAAASGGGGSLPRVVFLVGLPGSGKSTFASALEASGRG